MTSMRRHQLHNPAIGRRCHNDDVAGSWCKNFVVQRRQTSQPFATLKLTYFAYKFHFTGLALLVLFGAPHVRTHQ